VSKSFTIWKKKITIEKPNTKNLKITRLFDLRYKLQKKNYNEIPITKYSKKNQNNWKRRKEEGKIH